MYANKISHVSFQSRNKYRSDILTLWAFIVSVPNNVEQVDSVSVLL